MVTTADYAAYWTPDDDPPAPLKFDRRRSERWETQGAATAFCLGGMHFGEIVELELIDYSAGGMAAVSTESLEPGTIVSVGFERGGRAAQRGEVVRCLPNGDGYAIGIRFLARMAA